jgi:hypothetical protein
MEVVPAPAEVPSEAYSEAADILQRTEELKEQLVKIRNAIAGTYSTLNLQKDLQQQVKAQVEGIDSVITGDAYEHIMLDELRSLVGSASKYFKLLNETVDERAADGVQDEDPDADEEEEEEEEEEEGEGKSRSMFGNGRGAPEEFVRHRQSNGPNPFRRGPAYLELLLKNRRI